MVKKVTLFIFISCQTAFLTAQLNPPDAPVLFREDTVPRIDIFIDPDSLAILLEDVATDHEYRARFVYNNLIDICDTIENIGFRIRGNVSRLQEKKSFKISFNTYKPGRKYYGLEKMNLKGTGDDSFVRPKLAWKVCRGMGIPATWVSHVMLYINNELWGVYSNTEHIDEQYIQKVFGNNEGNLYKCRYPASLEFLTHNPDDYKFENEYFNNRSIRVYELKTNTSKDNYTDLMEFIAELDDNSGTDFRERISNRINMVSLLKFFAIEAYLGHWDSYSYSGNNYYLYHNQQTSRFEYITYDMDLTMGINFGGPDVYELDIYSYYADPVTRPLRKKILDVEEFRDHYTFFLKQLTERFPPDSLLQYALEIQDYIAPFVEQDSFFNYTMPEFYDALYNPIGMAQYGVIDYLETSYTKILEQVQNSNTKPIIHNLHYSDHFFEDTVSVFCTVEDDDPSVQVELCYEFNDGELISFPMPQVSESELLGVAHYAIKINPFEEAGVLNFYIKATDSQQQVSTNPYSGRYTLEVFADPPDLRINELLASNTECMTDEFGERDDWIEIINAGEEAVYMGNIYLSDKRNNYDEWQLPAQTLQPGEIAWFWADGETEQGEKHAGFRLSRGGETSYMFQKRGETFVLLDSLNFPKQESNISYGLYPGEPIRTEPLANVTPGYPNDTRGLAFLSFDVDMSPLIESNAFDPERDALDVVFNFSNWNTPYLLYDTDADSIFSQSVYNLSADQPVSYSLRIDGNENLSEYAIHNPGNYVVREGCNVINMFPQAVKTSVPDNGLLPEITLYPNPVTDFVTLRLAKPGQILLLVDLKGNILKQYSLNGESSITINARHLMPGIYLLRVITENQHMRTLKLIKK